MKWQPSEQFRTAVLVTLIGGFLESYSYITRNGVFANAQTGNIARFAMAIGSGELSRTTQYLFPIAAYISGLMATIRFRVFYRTHPVGRFHWRQFTVLTEAVLMVAISLIPANACDQLSTVLISFTCAVQVESFRKFCGNSLTSTMCTGNLRIATEGIGQYFETRDRKYLEKGLLYYLIDLIFICGVILGYFLTNAFRCRAIWICLLPLGIVFFLMRDEGRSAAAETQ